MNRDVNAAPASVPAQDADRRAGAPRYFLVAILILATVVLLVKGVSAAPLIEKTITYPFQRDDAEGVILAEATLIAGGTNPYMHQPSPAPYFYAGPYPPIYTLINAAAVAALGPTFKVGRIVQFLATIAVAAWLVGAIVWPRRGFGNRRGVIWLVGLWTALLWLTAHLVTVWGVLVRPDMTALVWNLLGVVVLRQWWDIPHKTDKDGKSTWPDTHLIAILVCGAACFALGWWTKQTFIAVPVAFMLTLFRVQFRVAVVLAVVYGFFLAVPFTVLTVLTEGGFAQKVIGYQGSWDWGAFRRFAVAFVARYGALLLVAVLVALVSGARERRLTFAAAWFALAGIAALGAGTSGGNHNHFVELLAAAALLAGQGVMDGVQSVTAQAARARFTAACVALVIILLTGAAAFEQEGRYGWLARYYAAPSLSERAGMAAVASYLANAPMPVYSDNVGILVVARQAVRVTDPFTMAAEVRLGRWDDTALVADVAAGKYTVIAIRERDLDPAHPPTDMTPELVRAILARYRLAERNVLNLYVPK